jgi:hypothetical protein
MQLRLAQREQPEMVIGQSERLSLGAAPTNGQFWSFEPVSETVGFLPVPLDLPSHSTASGPMSKSGQVGHSFDWQ